MTRYASLAALLVLSACGGTSAAAPADSTSEASAPLALPNQAEAEGYVTGGQPTEADLRAAADAGFETVVSLRTEAEPGFEAERTLVEELGMSFVSLPIAGADGLTPENTAAFDRLLSSAAPASTIVHCGSGNRAGALFALRAFMTNHSVEASMELGRSAGLTGLAGAVEERLSALCAADDACP